MSKLVVLRHLKTQDGLETRFCSGERDIPILLGQTVAFETFQRIRKLVGEDPYVLAHTGLVRTGQTALLLGEALGYSGTMLIFPEFRERFGGKLTGLQFEEIQKIFPNLGESRELWTVGVAELGLESVDDFLARIENGLRLISALKKTVVLVAHAGSIKGIRAVLETEMPEERKQILVTKTPKNAEIFIFETEGGKMTEKEFRRYLRRQGCNEEAIRQTWQILVEWSGKGIRPWPLKEENKKTRWRLGVIVANAIERGTAVRFFGPICPDYPLNSRTGKLGKGIHETTLPFLSTMKTLTAPLVHGGISFEADLILADTETDLPEVVLVLAGTSEEFLARCQKSVEAIRQETPERVMVSTFSEFFGGRWHEMQYFWEEVIYQRMTEDEKLGRCLRSLAWQRREKYESQFGRQLTMDECLKMAIRHYAQYSTLGYWMRQYPGAVLINTDSPNLRAINKPFMLSDFPGIFPKVADQQQRVPVIVP